MATCMNCQRKTGIRNPEYYLDSRSNDVLCGKCYDALKHFNLKMSELTLDAFKTETKLVMEEMDEQNFNEKSKDTIIRYMEKQHRKIIEKEMDTKRSVSFDKIEQQMVTTGYNFEGYQIKKYVGVISGESALGLGAFSGWSASASSFLGTESGWYGKAIAQAKENAMRELIISSVLLGGNAIIGVDFDYIHLDSLVCVSANGTCVIIEEI